MGTLNTLRFVRATLAGLLFLSAPSSAWAQGPLENAAGRIPAGEIVRIRTHDGRLVQGHLSERDRNALPLGNVDSIWVRNGTHAKTGAIIGATVVGVASAVFWSSLCTSLNEGSGCDEWQAVGALTLAGAGVGAGLGALIGSASPRWRLSYAHSGPALRLLASPNHVGLSVTVPLSTSLTTTFERTSP